MSYILEALRKADAERERERSTVPELQAALLPGSPAVDEVQPRAGRRWLWPTLAVAGVALGLANWWFVGGEAVSTPPPLASRPVASTPAAAPSVAMVASAAAPSASVAASAAAAVVPAPPAAKQATTPKPDKAEAARARRAAAAAAAAAKARQQAPARAAARGEASAVAEAAPSKVPAAAPAVRVPRLNELPADLQRQVPALTVGGSVYSTQAEKRMVILNGQVFVEGAMLTAELKLEQILAKSAVLSIRGQRFELPL